MVSQSVNDEAADTGPRWSDCFSGLRFAFFSHAASRLLRFRLPIMRRLVESGASVFAIAPPDVVDSEFTRHGIEFVPLPASRTSLNPLRMRRDVQGLVAVLNEIRPSLVHAFTLRPNVYAALAKHRSGNPGVICTVTGLGLLYSPGAGWAMAALRFAVNALAMYSVRRRADAVVFQNMDDMSYYVRRGLCTSRQACLISSSGVDTADFSPSCVQPEVRMQLRSDLGIAEDSVVVMVACRFIRQKGVMEFLEAARRLAGEAVFVLVGEPDAGNLQSITWDAVNRHVQDGTVIAPGWQRDIRRWLAISDIYAFPSYYREGVPRSVLEAMGMELPIVTTDAPGCRETVVEHRNGILVAPRDVASLTEAIHSLIKDAELRQAMGRQSRRIAQQRFDVVDIVNQYLSLYRNIVALMEGSE